MKKLVKSPLPGKILEILVKEGQKISQGQSLFILESMKMHNDIVSEYDGTIKSILTNTNQIVSSNENIMELE